MESTFGVFGGYCTITITFGTTTQTVAGIKNIIISRGHARVIMERRFVDHIIEVDRRVGPMPIDEFKRELEAHAISYMYSHSHGNLDSYYYGFAKVYALGCSH